MAIERHDRETMRMPAVSDTAQWRQTLYISPTGMLAYLKNVEAPEEPVSLIVDRKWDVTEDSLLAEIENTVYDYPMLLDDFSTDIIIETGRYLWVPGEVMTVEGMAEEVYNSVYAANEEDLFADEHEGGCYCIYTHCPGLKAFLLRTFPGSRIMCHVSSLYDKFRERGADMRCVYIDIREREADYIAFDGKRLLCAGTHTVAADSDIMYHLFNLMEGYGLQKDDTQIFVSGRKRDKSALIASMRKYVKYVMLTMLPRLVSMEDMPLAAAFSVNRVSSRRRFEGS